MKKMILPKITNSQKEKLHETALGAAKSLRHLSESVGSHVSKAPVQGEEVKLPFPYVGKSKESVILSTTLIYKLLGELHDCSVKLKWYSHTTDERVKLKLQKPHGVQ
jgi:hypothetical protein